MVWQIEFADSAAKQLRKLDPQVAKRILTFLRDRIAPLDDRRTIGEALRGKELGDFWKYRVGDWRVIADIEDIGEVMRAGGIGVVVASKNPAFKVGDTVTGGPGVQEYWSVSAEQLKRSGMAKVDLRMGSVTQWLNVLGMPGMTGYFGLKDVGQPQAGETVVVSGAAGAVGQTVGQMARIWGCRVVGIAGGKAKCDWVVKELGFDACIDYKAGAVKDGLKEHCPKGVDVYFDNVGGEILDTVLTRINRKARIIICGAISQYNNTEAMRGPKNYMSLLVNRARMEGMVVFDYADRYPQAIAEMAGYLKDGRMKSKEDVVEGGVAAFPGALGMLFSGRNFGKLVLEVAKA